VKIKRRINLFKSITMKAKSTLILMVLIVTCLFSCVNTPKQPAEYKFEITGTFGSKPAYVGSDLILSNFVSFRDAEGNNHQWTNVSNGWSFSWQQKGNKFIDIGVTNTSGEGDVTIKLFRNNEQIATNTGYGGSYASILGNY